MNRPAATIIIRANRADELFHVLEQPKRQSRHDFGWWSMTGLPLTDADLVRKPAFDLRILHLEMLRYREGAQYGHRRRTSRTVCIYRQRRRYFGRTLV